jgi:pentapeptide MXKDX repeat protein
MKLTQKLATTALGLTLISLTACTQPAATGGDKMKNGDAMKSEPQKGGDAMKGDAMKDDKMKGGDAMKGDAMKDDKMKGGDAMKGDSKK